jgi:hypothetical protein
MRTSMIALATVALIGLGGAAQAQLSGQGSGTTPGTTGTMPGTTTTPAHPTPMAPGATDTNNPPGTAATRLLDRTLGTNTSGAYPQNSDGTSNNPPGTAAGRAADRATDGTATTAPGANTAPPDTRPSAPTGSSVGRATEGQTGVPPGTTPR